MNPIDVIVEAFWVVILIVLVSFVSWKIIKFLFIDIPTKREMDKFIRETQDRQAIEKALRDYEEENKDKE